MVDVVGRCVVDRFVCVSKEEEEEENKMWEDENLLIYTEWLCEKVFSSVPNL